MRASATSTDIARARGSASRARCAARFASRPRVDRKSARARGRARVDFARASTLMDDAGRAGDDDGEEVDLVAELRLGEARTSTRERRRANRARDGATKALLAVALGFASMMPQITSEAPTPSPVVSGVKRTVVAGTVKSATSDARRLGSKESAEERFQRDVDQFIGRVGF